MTVHRLVLPLAALFAIACGAAPTLRVRMDVPAGAELRIDLHRPAGQVVSGGEPVEVQLPMIAEMETSTSSGYPVVMTIPREVARRYGADREVVLRGSLWVFAPTDDVPSGSLVPLPLPDAREAVEERFRNIVRGEVSTIEFFTTDPTAGRNVVRIELHGGAP